MMKLQISIGRETASFVPVTNKNLAAVRNANQRLSEPLCIGAPTESPKMKSRSMKIKAFTCAAILAAICTAETFATQPLGSGFTYQGRLNDGGAPANGTYDLGFVLHDDPTNMSCIGNSIIFSAVPVTNGLFTVQLNSAGEFGPGAFNGQARWLEVDVRTNNNLLLNNFTVLSPRQPLTPTPQAMFAMNASNAMNASFAANVADGSISNSKLAPGAVQAGNLAPGAVAWSSITGIPAGFADGIDNDTTYAAGPGLTLSGGNNQFSVNYGGTGSANSASHSDHNHFGANWGGSTQFGLGLSVTNGAANSTGLYGQQGTGSGFPYVFGNTAGVWGESSQGSGVYGASGTFRGVQGVSLGAQGAGVYGIALATNGSNYGVYGKTASANGVGVYGLNQNPTTNGSVTSVKSHSSAVLGESSNGYGVAGISDNSVGVVGGSGSSIGVYGTSTNSTGVYGSSQSAVGVYGSSVSGVAVEGSSFGNSALYGSSFYGFGVEAYSSDGAAVYGNCSDGYAGVIGACNAGSGVSGFSQTGIGVEAQSDSGVPLNVASSSTNSSASMIEAYQYGAISLRRFRVTVGGEVYASGAFHPNGADFAEMLPGAGALEPGDVLVIGENGKLARSTEACQESVAGVHATKPGLLGGAPDGADLTGKVPLAVVGVVPVKVTNQNGAIKPGDKLTASSTAGHAMKAGKGAKVGTVIGKALTALEGKQGVIQMLVVLQ